MKQKTFCVGIISPSSSHSWHFDICFIIIIIIMLLNIISLDFNCIILILLFLWTFIAWIKWILFLSIAPPRRRRMCNFTGGFALPTESLFVILVCHFPALQTVTHLDIAEDILRIYCKIVVFSRFYCIFMRCAIKIKR